MQPGKVVPFGKYKNQPIEVLAEDKSYCEWLAGQGWVAQRYPDIHTIIINNFAEPSETPEHNAMQARFLDDRTCLQAFHAFIQQQTRFDARIIAVRSLVSKAFEIEGIDVSLTFNAWAYVGRRKHIKESRPGFSGEVDVPVEYCDWDIGYFSTPGESFSRELSLAIELKPSLGDDYPSILRQILHRKTPYGLLIIDEYAGRGATFEQVGQIYTHAGVVLLLWDVIESAPDYCWPNKPLFIPQGITKEINY